jgi:thiazole synthase
MPDPLGTVKAADYLVKKGFKVFPYINADPILCRHLEELGCVTIMPLGSSIGSNQGLRNLENLRIIIEESSLPVIPDAGIGRPSDACKALELGAEAVLTNTAISGSLKPEIMAQAMKLAVLSGRLAYLASSPPLAPTKGSVSSPKCGAIF